MRRVFSRLIFVWAVSICILLLVVQTISQQPTSDVRVMGIRVVDKPFGGDRNVPYSGLRAFNWSTGTSVALLFKVPGGNVIRMDNRESRVKSFTDSSGNSLLTDAKAAQAGFGFPNISKDRKAFMVEVKGPGVPAQGTTRVSGSGEVYVLCSSGKEDLFEAKDLPIRKGAKIRIERFEFEVSDIQKPSWGEFKHCITLKSTEEYRKIKSIAFFTTDGKEIKSSASGTTRTESKDGVIVKQNYNLMEKPEKITIKVTCWKDLTVKKIPFSFTATLGL